MTRAELYAQLDAANDKLREVKRQHASAERELATLNWRLRNATNDRDRIWGKVIAELESDTAQPTPAVMEKDR